MSEVVIIEVCEQMKLLEKEFNGKDFFGGDDIGFVDLILPMVWKANFCEGDERELVIEEVREYIKILEKELDGKDFFKGSSIGFVDIAGIVVAFWFQLT
ncbi:hypothetical protein Q3G72_028926 [Acer saccharum]|nr:hypothetical protein Q3G72_028926 [Acer saccharum]